MESNRDLGSLDLRSLEGNRSNCAGCRNVVVEVDAAVNLSLQLPTNAAFNVPSSFSSRGNDLIMRSSANEYFSPDIELGSREPVDMEIDTLDSAIPFMDDDDDQASNSASKKTDANETFDNVSFKNVTLCNSCPPPAASTIFKECAKPNYRDLTRPVGFYNEALGRIDNKSSDEVEYGEVQNLQQHMPSLIQNFDPTLLANDTAADEMRRRSSSQGTQQNGNRMFSDINSILKSGAQDDILQKNNSSSTTDSAAPLVTRTGKTIRRKQRDDKNVIKSEQIDGYRGHLPLDETLAFIEGSEALKKSREEQGKRTKKKSFGSADQANAAAVNNVRRSMEENEKTKEAEVEKTPSQQNDDATSPTDSAKADIPVSEEIENVAEDADLKNDDPDYSSLASTSTNRSGSSSSDTIVDNPQNVEKKESVSMPPAKFETSDFEPMNFVCDSPEHAGKRNADRLLSTKSVGGDKKNERQEPLPSLTGDKNEVLQMLFASCKNGESSVNIKTITKSSSFNSENDNSGPVQFLGMAASNSEAAYDLSFVFGDEDDEDDCVINAVMTRSAMTYDQLTKDGSFNNCAISESNSSRSQRGTSESDSGERRGKRETAGAGGGPYQKAIREMTEFANQAWSDFTRGIKCPPFYVPQKMKN